MHVLSMQTAPQFGQLYFSSLHTLSAHVHAMHVLDIRHSGIILTPLMPNFVSVAPSIAELAREEKLCTQSINH